MVSKSSAKIVKIKDIINPAKPKKENEEWKEKERQRHKKYNEEHKEEIKERQKKFREEHKNEFFACEVCQKSSHS